MNRKSQLSYVSEVESPAKKALVNSIELLSGRRRLEKLYHSALAGLDGQHYHSVWEAALAALQVRLEYDTERLAAIPRSGPLIFIANHPYGVLDGLALCYLASLTRGRDFRIMLISALCREERIADYVLPIDFSGTEEATRTNIATKHKAAELLRNGGALVIFPGGGISTAQGPFGQVIDLEWKLFTAKLVQTTHATVAPIFFHGQNGRLFQMVSQFSLTLRLALIIRELNHQVAQTLKITIGAPIRYEELAAISSRQALIEHLRRTTYALGGIHNPGVSTIAQRPQIKDWWPQRNPMQRKR